MSGTSGQPNFFPLIVNVTEPKVISSGLKVYIGFGSVGLSKEPVPVEVHKTESVYWVVALTLNVGCVSQIVVLPPAITTGFAFTLYITLPFTIDPHEFFGVTSTVNVILWSLSKGDGLYIGELTVASTNFPSPPSINHLIDPAFWILEYTFTGPSHTILFTPKSTVGFLTIVKITLSVAGVKQGLFPVPESVSTTAKPSAISSEPGV